MVRIKRRAIGASDHHDHMYAYACASTLISIYYSNLYICAYPDPWHGHGKRCILGLELELSGVGPYAYARITGPHDKKFKLSFVVQDSALSRLQRFCSIHQIWTPGPSDS